MFLSRFGGSQGSGRKSPILSPTKVVVSLENSDTTTADIPREDSNLCITTWLAVIELNFRPVSYVRRSPSILPSIPLQRTIKRALESTRRVWRRSIASAAKTKQLRLYIVPAEIEDALGAYFSP